MGDVKYTVKDSAFWQLHLEVTGAPDTEHPDHPGGSVRPVGISMGIGQTGGVWSVSVVNVFGPKIKDGKVVTKRNYPLSFMDPLDEDSGAPEWLRKICQDWVDRANGKTGSAPKEAHTVEQPVDEALVRRIEELEAIVGILLNAQAVRFPGNEQDARLIAQFQDRTDKVRVHIAEVGGPDEATVDRVMDGLSAVSPAPAEPDEPTCGCGADACEVCTPIRHLSFTPRGK